LLRFLRATIAEVRSPGFSRHFLPPTKTGTQDPELRELSVALIDDAAIAAISQQFLNHVGPTDVISFDLGDGLGEIVVSAERACIVAKKLRRTPSAELALYLVHGLLHLAGLDDQTPAQRRAMRAAERRCLRQLRNAIPRLGGAHP
jgi:probable rRNA maturation factor